ncbi:hypothetical protein Micbo1qcDRAFT_65694 [Microdochium bolleyi]|uniref:Uncharacterized protein n=1 Tax=Microdochium bolleyi TaxID=196109 RepID=A0A136J2V6_9PEZI|nr:hypothetical protein Micbo1qcDRAFT_65694 [Microdochium bolleyi]
MATTSVPHSESCPLLIGSLFLTQWAVSWDMTWPSCSAHLWTSGLLDPSAVPATAGESSMSFFRKGEPWRSVAGPAALSFKVGLCSIAHPSSNRFPPEPIRASC